MKNGHRVVFHLMLTLGNNYRYLPFIQYRRIKCPITIYFNHDENFKLYWFHISFCHHAFYTRITVLTPWKMNVLRLRLPLPFFVTEDSRCFPSEQCWRGTNPLHADNSRPLENGVASTTLINTAAINGPAPGIVNK